MKIEYTQPSDKDWEWFIPRYAGTAWESMRPHRQAHTSIEEVQDNLRKQVEKFCGPDGLAYSAYVAKNDDGARVGFIWMIESTSGFTASTFGWVMCVYVEAGFRGAGIGRRLMELGETWAREQGLIDIILNVSNQNNSAIKLYESLGYELETKRYIKRIEA